MHRKILVADSEQHSLSTLAAFLDHCGYHVSISTEGSNVLKLLNEEHFDVTIIDYALSCYGISVVEIAKNQAVPAALIITTQPCDIDKERRIRSFGADYYFVKPIDIDTLAMVVTQCFRVHDQKMHNL